MYSYRKGNYTGTHMTTRSGGKPPMPTHRYSTRFKDNAGTARPFVPPVDTAIFFEAGGSRPSFELDTENRLYEHPIKVGGVDCYECKISRHETKLLPRKRDATEQQKEAGAFATIGHIMQWQDYVALKCAPQRGKWGDYEYEAYAKEDVALWYNDVNNLELQSMSYNSSIAQNYDGTSPLTPTWVEE